MVAFKYNDEWYLRVVPTKRLFNSTTVWEVVNRGDIFAVRLSDSVLTIVPGKSKVEFVDIECLVSGING